jgi:hypothetical protein
MGDTYDFGIEGSLDIAFINPESKSLSLIVVPLFFSSSSSLSLALAMENVTTGLAFSFLTLWRIGFLKKR